MSGGSEFDKFDAVVSKVFSVPRAEILKRERSTSENGSA